MDSLFKIYVSQTQAQYQQMQEILLTRLSPCLVYRHPLFVQSLLHFMSV